jgi:serine/threonine protein phosphatase 1
VHPNVNSLAILKIKMAKHIMIKHLSANLKGRDFVCGDIHGSFSCVERFLKEINFRLEDRLICAGDLVDRGPENERCLDLLYMPWFYACKGNHEVLMEEAFAGGQLSVSWELNGGAWGQRHLHDLSDESMRIRDTVKEKVGPLPYLITVDKKDGTKFHVLHAELYARGQKITDEIMADWDKLSEFAMTNDGDGEMIIWGRLMFMRMYKRILDDRTVGKIKRGAQMEKLNAMFNPELSPIYSGHTIVTRPVQFYGQTNLDTMAYGSYYEDAPDWCGLTFTEPETGRFWFVNDKEFKEVQPVVIDDSPPKKSTLADNPEAT